MPKERKIIIKKQKCDSSSGDSCNNSCDSSSVEAIFCSESASNLCKDDSSSKILIVEASSSCSSSSSCETSYQEAKLCKRVKQPKYKSSSCKTNYNGLVYYDFCAIVRPVRNFALLNGKSCGELKVYVSIVGRMVTLQWEGFTGQVDSSNIAYLYINQSFRMLPKTSIFGSYLVNFKSADAISAIEVIPDNTNTIRWYLYESRKSSNVSSGDNFTVYPGSITYLADC